MNKLLIASAMIAFAMPAAATAQTPRQAEREYQRDVRDAQREYREDIRDARNGRDVREARQEYREDVRDARRDRRQAQRDWRQYRRYDWNRNEPGQRAYYADNYYRDGRYYRARALNRNDRIYRGNDGRYYCRRTDGTTGLIIGGAIGGLLGNSLANGGSNTIGTLLGAGAGALLGREVDRGRVTCR